MKTHDGCFATRAVVSFSVFFGFVFRSFVVSPGVGFRFSGPFVVFRGVFDTPVFACVSNGFGGVRVGLGCVWAGVGVSFSLAARHGVLPLGAGASGPVRWWFENSRACLYYFMQVNDCQSAVRFPLGSGRGALKVGGVFVR